MALPLNPDGLYTVAPASNSFLGTVRVKGKPDSHDPVSIRICERHDGFAAALIMDRAQRSVRQEVLFASLPDGKSMSWERWIARETVAVEAAEQGFLRIVNEEFAAVRDNCRGYRTIYTPGGSEVFRGFVSDDPASDVVRTFGHPGWLNVDDRIGIVFRGSGGAVYRNRHHFKTWWAVADDLTLSMMDPGFEVRAGGTVAELAALVAPGQRHEKTAAQQFVVLRSGRRAVALIADGYLAAANFGPEPRTISFAARRADLPRVPVFEGSALVSADKVTYRMPLQAGEAMLRKAMLELAVEGRLELTASSAGRVLARNAGRSTAAVRAGRSGRTIRIAPGGIAVLR
ncbi:MAG: hypothetical protein N3A38_02600 [Planctomycetota bacterium]|nr:hypothetical protein [Planctomycetota bacterium]